MTKSRKPSRFEAIHDRYLDPSPKKAGAKYERLTALVLKTLDNAGVVVHDLKLRGESTVKHQIDVVFDTSGGKQRILIECKDFDVSGDLVGLGIVRDFLSVVRDIRPDRAIILTCNGFEKNAETFAQHNGIELAELREFRESDWEGLIKTVNVTIIAPSTELKSISFNVRKADDQEHARRITGYDSQHGQSRVDRDTPIYITKNGVETQIFELLMRIKNEHDAPEDGIHNIEVESDDLSLRVPNSQPIPLRSISIVLEHRTHRTEMQVTSSKLEELLLHWQNGAKQIVYSEDLEKLSIDRQKRIVVPRADQPPSGKYGLQL